MKRISKLLGMAVILSGGLLSCTTSSEESFDLGEANHVVSMLSEEPVVYQKATFHANKPFVYVISERSSGVILFVGKFTGQ
jgi:serine protease inhibitor